MRSRDGYHNRYRRLYHALCAWGFPPAKAIEILIDAQRKDRHARYMIKIAHDAVRVRT